MTKLILVAPPSEAKMEMYQVWQVLQAWNWKITAYDIFVVDKQLISGLIATMMSYVVILFQVNLSDIGSANNRTVTDSVDVFNVR